MNKEMMRNMGFEVEVRRVNDGLCPFCGYTIRVDEFRDQLSREEFSISGLCQDCQDKTFK